MGEDYPDVQQEERLTKEEEVELCSQCSFLVLIWCGGSPTAHEKEDICINDIHIYMHVRQFCLFDFQGLHILFRMILPYTRPATVESHFEKIANDSKTACQTSL